MRVTADCRGVSESAGMAVLIGITLVVTGAVGVGVFLETADELESAEFTFNYAEELNQLVIVYQDDEELQASEVYVEGPAGNFTWAELAQMDEEGLLTEIDTIFANNQGPYGADVEEEDYFKITYVPDDDESTVLAEWNAEDDEEADDPLEPDTPEPDEPL